MKKNPINERKRGSPKLPFPLLENNIPYISHPVPISAKISFPMPRNNIPYISHHVPIAIGVIDIRPIRVEPIGRLHCVLFHRRVWPENGAP